MLERRARVREFIGAHLNGHHVTDGDDLFTSGYLNSLFAIQLVRWIEDSFGVPVAGQDLDLVNFRTIDAIDGFLERKLETSN